MGPMRALHFGDSDVRMRICACVLWPLVPEKVSRHCLKHYTKLTPTQTIYISKCVCRCDHENILAIGNLILKKNFLTEKVLNALFLNTFISKATGFCKAAPVS